MFVRRSLSRLCPLVLVCFGAAAGCASPWRHEFIRGRDTAFVYREFRTEDASSSPASPYDHPAQVSPEEWYILLSRLEHQDKPLIGTTGHEPVFREREILPLSTLLASALAEVAPHERVRFLVVRSGVDRILLGLSGVSGVAFVQNGTLHIAFDAIGDGIYEGSTGRAQDVRFPYDPTEENYRLGLVPPWPWTRLHVAPDGETRKRWLEVDLQELARATTEPPSDADPVVAEAPPAIAPTDVDAAPSATASAAPDVPSHETSDPSPPAEGIDRVAEKLEALKTLRARGVLTEEEYQRAVDKALEDL